MVDVLGIDSTYLHVVYQDNEGFIFRRQAVIDRQVAKKQLASAGSQSGNEPQDRFTYLENKYGTNMANKLIAGKIWKGMNAEMANDSWGTADKINRIISGNIVKEEWIFRSTWLYFENNTLLEWGPVTKR
jgi:16S rRNA C1402 N4-methylase RsmH